MLFACPEPLSLTAIPIPNCTFKLDQIVKLAFQRRQTIAAPSFATLADIQTLSNWQTLMNATDNAKIVVTPLFAGMTIPQSTAITTGGNDNTTIGGVPEYHGEGFVTVTGTFKNLDPVTKRALDKLIPESIPGSTGRTRLTVYMFNKDGYSFQSNLLNTDETLTTKYNGIEIFNFRISSLGSEGLNAPNTYGFSFEMKADWADALSVVKPTFDPLVDLVSVIVHPTLTTTIDRSSGGTTSASGVTVNSTATAGTAFKFNAADINGGGASETMNVMVGGVQVAQVVYTNEANGRNCAWVSGGITYYGVFGSGNMTFSV